VHGTIFYVAIVTDALHFSSISNRVDIEPRSISGEIACRIGGEPHRRFHALAVLFECFEADVFVIAKGRKSHVVAPANSMHLILYVAQKCGTDILVCLLPAKRAKGRLAMSLPFGNLQSVLFLSNKTASRSCSSMFISSGRR
jgi:hypothetical protein